ncbi:unnamed protein product [Linum tenue]|uniref:At1g68980-like TPR repeats domain-containing protein n=2 Tax=Linum tenue TaxID=586396 RepID=A0AAV0I281_9ROSI|nr:unnamed protein product [Linum tenue]
MLSRIALSSFRRRRYTSEAGTEVYSFLKSSIFSVKRTPPAPAPVDQKSATRLLNHDQATHLESTLEKSLLVNETDEAWKSFKSLTSNSALPSKPLTNSLITHLASAADTLNLKRAFASVIYCVEKGPALLDFDTVRMVLKSMVRANTAAPAFALIKCMFKNRYFMPFGLWGDLLIEVSRKNVSFCSFLELFEETCRVAVDEKLVFMKPDLDACNVALEGCCRELESIRDAERVIETMSVLNIKPDEFSFGFLGYLYALKGHTMKINELKGLIKGFGFSNSSLFYSSLIGGYVKSGNLKSVSATILSCLKEENEEVMHFSRETFCEVINGFLKHGSVKDLADLIIEAQKLEPPSTVVERSIGFGIIDSCVSLGLSDKAHSIVDEMVAQGSTMGLGVYLPILKAYCKEHRTAEATQLVMEISNSGMHLSAESFDSLIDAAMTSQDFQSAFTLFRDMREARVPELKGSYLTIMTGLMASHRPELMAAFLDEIVEDPRIEVKTHDWNSIIHAFCKAGRLEDARRTFRRMVFLQYEPNDQTYLSLINGYVTAEKYFSVLMHWNEVKRRISTAEKEGGVKFDHALVDAFLYALVKGGYFDAVMQVVEKSQEMKIFVDKWRYKQAFMETHKKLKVSKMRKRNFRKMEALIAFKNWAGLNA